MPQQWRNVLMALFGIFALLIPGVRRFIFYRFIKNRMMRNLGIKIIMAVPFLREKMMSNLFPKKPSL